ncbi:PREDICTED: uncharacterized protein At2g39920-like [Nelumbo nucifera]|uniref:Uncharacterized protein At2g39920-like n=1 Tax=Nelumbo nucifera TaxID=4432 RepID=A0A1U8Q5Q6_NELNU|nr:PREDICTED: uncharacterized protein At2g39920-like [Nelumbo nucifera]
MAGFQFLWVISVDSLSHSTWSRDHNIFRLTLRNGKQWLFDRVRNAGVIELRETIDDFDYCKAFALHVEVNNLELDEFPTICKTYFIWYFREGQYLRDLNLTMLIVERYFRNLAPEDDGLDVSLIDIYDIFPSNPHHTHPLLLRSGQHDRNDWVGEVRRLAHMRFLRLLMKLQSSGWSLIFITRKREEQCNATTKELISAGYGGWASLIMRSDDEMQMDSWKFFNKRRAELLNQGFRMASVISSRMDALTGPCLGKRNFKLANPIF